MISISILAGGLDPCSFVTDGGLGGAVDFRRPYGTRFVLVGRHPPVNWRAIISGPSGTHWAIPLFSYGRIAPGRFRIIVRGARVENRQRPVNENLLGNELEASRGTSDNSPAFKRRVSGKDCSRPVGTPETGEDAMPHTYVSDLVHCVFSTKERRKLIRPETQSELWSFIGGIARKNGFKTLIVGGTDDHVHILLSLPATMPLAKALQLLKGCSSDG